MNINVSFPGLMCFCLVATIIIELLGAIIAHVSKKGMLFVFLAQIMTNPIVVSVSYSVGFYFGSLFQIIALVLLEFFAFTSEGLLYKKCLAGRHPFLLSLVLNFASFMAGNIIGFFIHFTIIL